MFARANSRMTLLATSANTSGLTGVGFGGHVIITDWRHIGRAD
jgi:hypothetical protein